MIPGERVGPYIVMDRLGAGGMGEVYRARDTRLNRTVALKRLSNPALASEDARQRVLREARAAGALSHPHIATIFDVLDTPEGLVIVMEHVPGESLAASLRRGALPAEQAIRFAGQISDALVEAHDHGVVHRDLKPANIHITPDGKAKILDFGIARSAPDPTAGEPAPDDMPTETGLVIGTPGYMSPEQFAGGRVDHRTDIYGVGLLLFEMLTGRRPFQQTDALGRALAVFDTRVPRVSALAPDVPDAVSDLVARAMAGNPQDRFGTARELSEALAQAGRGLGDVPTVTAGTGKRTFSGRTVVTWIRQRPATTATSLIVVAGVVFGLMVWMRPWWTVPVSAHSSVIGVAPFLNQSGNASNEALAVGLREAVAKRLAAVPSLRVLPLEEAREAAPDAGDLQKAARSLGAAFVVEGTLQRMGEGLVVDVSLVAADGRRRPVGRYGASPTAQFDLHRRVAEGLTSVLHHEGAIHGSTTPGTAPPTTNQDAFAEYTQGRVFLERPDVPGNLDHAVRLFQSAIAKDTRFALAHAGLGEAYWAQYRETNDAEWTTKATGAILDALRLDPAQPEVRMSLAVMYQGLGRRDEAIEELRQVIALQPRNDNPHRVWAAIHAAEGSWKEAAAEGRQAVELRPNYWRNHAELGDTFLRAGQFDAAIGAYQRVIELQPDSVRGYQRLGTAQQASGRLAAALENYQRATAIRPSAGTYSNMGTAYYWSGDFAKAADVYERAIALAPHRPDLYANLGDAHQRLGRKDRALANYRRAIDEVQKLLAVKANDASNLASLALYQAKLGQQAAAAGAVAKAVALSPQDGDVLYVRAVVHALGRDNAAACAALESALANGASTEVIRHADELKPLKGCAAYDRVVDVGKPRQED
jgi:tetratricopeptide (TPR) repeat protein